MVVTGAVFFRVAFRRSITLPNHVAADKIEASGGPARRVLAG